MKRIVFIFLVVVIFSCKKENQENFGKTTENESVTKISGQELFEGTGNCIACHATDKKLIGPGLQEIAKIYKEKNGSIVSFLKEQSKPIVDPSQYEVMKTNFTTTKSMKTEELKALEEYILDFAE